MCPDGTARHCRLTHYLSHLCWPAIISLRNTDTAPCYILCAAKLKVFENEDVTRTVCVLTGKADAPAFIDGPTTLWRLRACVRRVRARAPLNIAACN